MKVINDDENFSSAQHRTDEYFSHSHLNKKYKKWQGEMTVEVAMTEGIP